MDAFWAILMQRMNKKINFNQGWLNCDEWVGGLEHGTYGKMSVTWPDGEKTRERTHRLAFMASHKILRGDMPRVDASGRTVEVSHLCHNGICVNPAHLVLESHERNLERICCKSRGQCTKLHQPYCLI